MFYKHLVRVEHCSLIPVTVCVVVFTDDHNDDVQPIGIVLFSVRLL